MSIFPTFQLQRGALPRRAISAGQPLPAQRPLQRRRQGIHLLLDLFLTSFSNIYMLRHQEEHRGQAPPQPVQPELEKLSRTTSVPGSWQRRERRRRDERLTTKSTTTTTTTTHPKMRIDQNGGVFKDSATPDEDQTKRDSRRSTSICSTFLFVPQLITLVTQIGRLLFASSQIDQATSNS